MLLALGLMVALFVIGGTFFAGGLEARSKLPYPWRRLDMSWQLGVGGLALLMGGMLLLGLLRRVLTFLLG